VGGGGLWQINSKGDTDLTRLSIFAVNFPTTTPSCSGVGYEVGLSETAKLKPPGGFHHPRGGFFYSISFFQVKLTTHYCFE
jgi:hypothetical protein